MWQIILWNNNRSREISIYYVIHERKIIRNKFSRSQLNFSEEIFWSSMSKESLKNFFCFQCRHLTRHHTESVRLSTRIKYSSHYSILHYKWRRSHHDRLNVTYLFKILRRMFNYMHFTNSSSIKREICFPHLFC